MKKIEFAQQLRAVAALAVVINHYWGVYFLNGFRPLVGIPVSFVPAQPALTHHVMYPGSAQFLYGHFGVGLFFLISGFVISISLKSLSPGVFLVRRFFRIYPVYWFSMLVSVLMYFICSWYWNTPLPGNISLGYLLKAMPLVHSAAGIPSIDFVNWSLAVELKFYVLFALFYALAGNHSSALKYCAVFSVASCGLVYLVVTHFAAQSKVYMIVADLQYILFIFVGCVFYSMLKKSASMMANAIYLLIFWLAFYFVNVQFENKLLPEKVISYTYALVVFSVCYLARDFFKKNRVLDFLADISYPLYLVHSMIGYTLMSILMDQRYSFWVASNVSLLCSIVVSALIHKYVELPSNAWGKTLSR